MSHTLRMGNRNKKKGILHFLFALRAERAGATGQVGQAGQAEQVGQAGQAEQVRHARQVGQVGQARQVGRYAAAAAVTLFLFAQSGVQAQGLTQPRIGGAVYGGGCKADVQGSTLVTVNKCDAAEGIGAVYGGNDIAGQVRSATPNANSFYGADVVIGTSATDDTMKIGSVYGGGNGNYQYPYVAGYGAEVDSKTITDADSNSGTEVTVLGAMHDNLITHALAHGQVYEPYVNGEGKYDRADIIENDAGSYVPSVLRTRITVCTDAMQRYVHIDSLFGGARNAFVHGDAVATDATDATANSRSTDITINGGTVGLLFGGNNVGGSLTENSYHHIDIVATTINPATPATPGAKYGSVELGTESGIQYLFGGGNMVRGRKVAMTISGGQIDTCFAGGNRASVDATTVTVDVVSPLYTYDASKYNLEAEGYDLTTRKYSPTASRFDIRCLFGGNNIADMAAVPNLVLTRGGIHNVYGGGNRGNMQGAEAYSDNDDVEAFIAVNPSAAIAPTVQSSLRSTRIEVASAGIIIDTLYGGGQSAGTSHDTYVELSDGDVGTLFGGTNISGNIGVYDGGQKSNVWVHGGEVHESLFGGSNGFYRCMDGNAYAAGVDQAALPGNAYSSFAGTVSIPLIWHASVLMTGGRVDSNLYGGGNMAYMGQSNEGHSGSTRVHILGGTVGRVYTPDGGSETTIAGNVYGGGNYATVYGTADLIVDNSLPIAGSTPAVTIYGNAYGGNDKTGTVTGAGRGTTGSTATKLSSAKNANYDVASLDANLLFDGVSNSLNFNSSDVIPLLPRNAASYVKLGGTVQVKGDVYGGGNGDYRYYHFDGDHTDIPEYIAGSASAPVALRCSQAPMPDQGSTFVDVCLDADGRVNRLFGGGNNATVGSAVTVSDGSSTTTVAQGGTVTVNVNCVDKPGNGTGDSPQIMRLFGGSNQVAMNVVPRLLLQKGKVRYVYGGGNLGDMRGQDMLGDFTYSVSTYVALVSPDIVIDSDLFGGCNAAQVRSHTYIKLREGTVSRDIFGGNDAAGEVLASHVIVEGQPGKLTLGVAEAPLHSRGGNIYGGGNGNYAFYRYDNSKHPEYMANKPADATNPYFIGDKSSGSMVYLYHDIEGRPYVGTTDVVIKGTVTVNGSVYGGGISGDCQKTSVMIDAEGGDFRGFVFGAGCGREANVGLRINGICKSYYIGVAQYNNEGDIVYGEGVTMGNVLDTSWLTVRQFRSMSGESNGEMPGGGHTGSMMFGGGRSGSVGTTMVYWSDSVHSPLDELYLGCLSSNVYESANGTINGYTPTDGSSIIGTIYGGNDFTGKVNRTNLTINKGTFDRFFGAGNGAYDYHTWLTTVSEVKDDPDDIANIITPPHDDGNELSTTGGICADTVPYSMEVNVTVNGGLFKENVYGGGNMGLVGDRDMIIDAMAAGDAVDNDAIGRITLNIHSPARFNRNVFAGARGETEMTRRFFTTYQSVSGTGSDTRWQLPSTTPQNVTHDALGKQLAYAQKIVNMDGGTIHLSLYGGSEAVDDGYPYECIGKEAVDYYSLDRLTSRNTDLTTHNTSLRPSTVMNIVGGNIRKSVYGGGYQGNTYGSIYVNIGSDAVNTSPVWSRSYGSGDKLWSMADYKPTGLVKREAVTLEASVYNGSDWGEAGDMAYFNTRGVYGGETNILIDGRGYNTYFNNPSGDVMSWPGMSIAFSVIGAGTSTEGGDVNRLITIRNFGDYDCNNSMLTSRGFYSIQRADKVVLDSVFITLYGEQDAFSAYASPSYSFNRIDTLMFYEDNIIIAEAPSIFIGNLASKRDTANDYVHVANDIAAGVRFVYTNERFAGGEGTDASPQRSNDLLDNLHSDLAEDESCPTDGDLKDACDNYDFCEKLPTARGKAGLPGAYNTLVLKNGSYMKIYPFIDEYDDVKLTATMDGKDDADRTGFTHPYGHVWGWMYLVSQDATQNYIYAADKSTTAPTINPTDGGFVGLCSCENTQFTYPGGAASYSDELDYSRINNTYRDWRVGVNQGKRTRHITLVANANPDDILNFNLPMGTYNEATHTYNKYYNINIADGTVVDSLGTGTHGQYRAFTDAPGTDTNTYFGYATTYLELPPAQGGNFYVINEVLIDQDNGNQMELTDQAYDHGSRTVFQYSADLSNIPMKMDSIANPTDTNDRNYTFGLTFSTLQTGSNFNASDCWMHNSADYVQTGFGPHAAAGHTKDTIFRSNRSSIISVTGGVSRTLATPEVVERAPAGGDSAAQYIYIDTTYTYDHCWPISIISGRPYLSEAAGYVSQSVSAGSGVIPQMLFTLTYDKRIHTTITRDVVFTMHEYTSTGEYVGPIDVTVTICTVIRDFSDLEAPVLAMYNEGISNEYVRKVTIPASFLQREVYLRGIEWELDPMDLQHDPDPAVAAKYANIDDWFYLQETTKDIDNTQSYLNHNFAGNDLFALSIKPSESTSENLNNHLGWFSIETEDIDIFSLAQEDYATTLEDPALEFSLAQKQNYNSWNYDGTSQKTGLGTGDGVLLGILDGRSTGSIDVTLKYNGDYVYHEVYNKPLARVTLHLFWKNTKKVDTDPDHTTEESKTDRGYIDLVINLRTREHGDTIYVAPGDVLTHTPIGTTTPLTVKSCHNTTNPGYIATVTHGDKDKIKDNPDFFVNTLQEALRVYDEGDVIAIMDPVVIDDENAVTVHGEDYSIIQIIRYSGSHYKFPSLGCANYGPMIEVKDRGRLNMRNVWLNGSGCTRVKEATTSGSGDVVVTYDDNTYKYYEKNQRVHTLLYAEAPILYCHGNGSVNFSQNVRMSNNFNASGELQWDAAADEGNGAWVANTGHLNGGAITLVRDVYSGVQPTVILGNRTTIYDNAVVDWNATRLAHGVTPPTSGPLNYGGGVYVKGGKLQLGTSVQSVNNEINIARNYYLRDTSRTNAGIRERKKYELGGTITQFDVFYPDTLGHTSGTPGAVNAYRLSNVHLMRMTSSAADFCPTPNPVRRDTLSDKIHFVSDLSATSRIGVSKWFPGYLYSGGTDHRLNCGVPRDTVGIAYDDSGKDRIATENFANGNFFNDSSYFVSSAVTYRDSYVGHESDSLAPRFVTDANYTLYHDDATNNPNYNDKVYVFHHTNVDSRHIYLQRCASFGKGVTQIIDSTCLENGNKLYFNNYKPGDSISYHWNPDATCWASTDTILFRVGGGFFPYTYHWDYDSVIDESGMNQVKLLRIPVRDRVTYGSNNISKIGTARNALLRDRAQRDTLVLRSLQQQPTMWRSTYFYYATANDLTGNCPVTQPVIVRVGKISDRGRDGVYKQSGGYYIDSVNFLRHRNPYAAYYNYQDQYSKHAGYYEEFPVSDGVLVDASDPSQGTGIRYDLTGDSATIPSAYVFQQDTNSSGQLLWIHKTTGDTVSGASNPDPSNYEPKSGFLYYRVTAPGVDSSSFHDHVVMDTVACLLQNGDLVAVFRNKAGDILFPYVRPFNVNGVAVTAADVDYATYPRRDTLGYEIRRIDTLSATTIKISLYRWNKVPKSGGFGKGVYTKSQEFTIKPTMEEMIHDISGHDWDGMTWTLDETYDSTYFKPVRYVPSHTVGNVVDTVSGAGIRRAGYSHLPMHWPSHRMNRGTLEQRVAANAFMGKPYYDKRYSITDAQYVDRDGTENDSLSRAYKSLYADRMIPRYLRVYRSYYVEPTIYPAAAQGQVDGYPINVDPSEFSDANRLPLSSTEFCLGDVIHLKPTPKAPTSNWEYMAWDFDPSAAETVSFVVSSDTNQNRPTVYYAPGDYWYQTVTQYSNTSGPGAANTATLDDYERLYNGDVVVKSRKGLAWLISVVNGYNGQNAHTFRHNTVYLDFTSNRRTVDGKSIDSVDMSAHKWTPLGNTNNPFEGTVVGKALKSGDTDSVQQHISGIVVNEGTLTHVGMFGYTDHANIGDFGLDSILLFGSSYVGSLVGLADTLTHVDNITVGHSIIFGDQVLGGLAARAIRSKLTDNTVKLVQMKGTAIYAGGLVGEAQSDTLRNNVETLDASNLSAIYLSPIIAWSSAVVDNSGGAKTVRLSEVNNNYASIITDGSSRRVGGLAGYAEGISLNNNYVYGYAKGTDYVGGLAGYIGSNVSISNCYYVQGLSGGAWGYTTYPGSVQKSTTFAGKGRDVILIDRVDGYSNMVRALNRWVWAHGDSIYNTWRPAHGNENSGFPVFGDPEMTVVRDSVRTETCDSVEWDGLFFDQSGRYVFHVVDSNDYLDSTFILLLTVNEGDTVYVSDTVTIGEGYQGHGFNLTSDEISAAMGHDGRFDVRTLMRIDSLLNAKGCDSLVVLTLYVLGNGVDIPGAQQALTAVKVYPNPTRGVVHVEGSELQRVEVYDNVSRKVLELRVSESDGDHVTFDLGNHPTGSYFIRVHTAHGAVVKKLIKK